MRSTALPEPLGQLAACTLQEGDPEGWWQETFKSHTDSKPMGPEAISLDLTFHGSPHLYGLPEHATSLSLQPTVGEPAACSLTELPAPARPAPVRPACAAWQGLPAVRPCSPQRAGESLPACRVLLSEKAPSTCATCQSAPSLALQHSLGEPAPAAACDLTMTLSCSASLHDLPGLLAETISLSRQAHTTDACAGCVAFMTPFCCAVPVASHCAPLPLPLPAHGGRPAHRPAKCSLGFAADRLLPAVKAVLLLAAGPDGAPLSDPYRLYNLDVFEYNTNSPFGLYGSIPTMLAHKPGLTIGAFW